MSGAERSPSGRESLAIEAEARRGGRYRESAMAGCRSGCQAHRSLSGSPAKLPTLQILGLLLMGCGGVDLSSGPSPDYGPGPSVEIFSSLKCEAVLRDVDVVPSFDYRHDFGQSRAVVATMLFYSVDEDIHIDSANYSGPAAASARGDVIRVEYEWGNGLWFGTAGIDLGSDRFEWQSPAGSTTMEQWIEHERGKIVLGVGVRSVSSPRSKVEAALRTSPGSGSSSEFSLSWSRSLPQGWDLRMGYMLLHRTFLHSEGPREIDVDAELYLHAFRIGAALTY